MSFDLALVDSIATSPTYRLHLNNSAPLEVMADGSSFGTPELRKARTSTLLTDGDLVAASSYGNRLLRMRIKLGADMANKDAAAAQVQLIARELDRETNFLRYRPGTTQPVFFRTLRSDFSAIEWDGVSAFATMEVEAEPFAFGLPETVSGIVVTNDPAAVSNGMFFDVSGVKGDVEAATQIADTSNAFYNSTIWLATRRRGTVANTPFVKQAEAMSLGTDTTLPGNDATMSGSGSNYARCTFATATMQMRLQSSFPTNTTTDARGVYRVIAGIKQSVSSDEITLQVRIISPASGDVVFTGDTISPINSSTRQHVDLGLISVPFGADPIYDGPSGVLLAPNTYTLQLRAARVSGSGNLDIDYLLFLPADEQQAPVRIGNDSNGNYVFDSYLDAVYSRASGKVDLTADIVVQGGLPSLLPNVTNRIFLVRDTSGADITKTVSMSYTYWPRYIYARPVGT